MVCVDSEKIALIALSLQQEYGTFALLAITHYHGKLLTTVLCCACCASVLWCACARVVQHNTNTLAEHT